jgi:glutamate dehydrogenase/leucine dehydrogenase
MKKNINKMLNDMGILYVTDYVANAGGLINCSQKLSGRIYLVSDAIEQVRKVKISVK